MPTKTGEPEKADDIAHPPAYMPSRHALSSPHDEEIVEIKAFLAEPTLRLKDLGDEIADLQKALDKLTAERARISVYVDAHRALISPARRLPLDIIQKIFIACLPTHRNCAMSAIEAPVLLGRVCSFWRSICLSTPRLWSKIHIVEPQCPYSGPTALFEEKLAQRLETIKMWLGRSGQCPLSISLQCVLRGYGGFTTAADQILQALAPFASHWEHLMLIHPSVLGTLLDLTERDVPRLKSVELHTPVAYVMRGDSFRFLNGPEVCSVSLFGANFTAPELPLLWGRLTHLAIIEDGWYGSITNRTALQVLSRCPQLRTCRLFIDDDRNESSRDGEPIVELSFLHTLCSLQHLKLRGEFDADLTDAEFYAPLLAAVPRLESLDVNIELFSKPSLIYLLRGLPPTLREIDISNHITRGGSSQFWIGLFGDKILESLIPSPDVPTPCPGLQTVQTTFPCSFADQTLLRFIKSRSLKRVVVHFNRAMEFDIRPELQPLVESGLHLELTYPPPAVLRFSPWEGL
ncbi:hypothetical protein FB451DRAFT_1193045 [Mycena latifolia]|nr:hypothetical protein FB451DRAFT_1193045 [Mycena latifolia]